MRSSSYADDPELLLRMVAKAVDTPPRSETDPPAIPLRARPVALLAAHQVRDREIRRDRMVRANWLLRNLLRELGRRLVRFGRARDRRRRVLSAGRRTRCAPRRHRRPGGAPSCRTAQAGGRDAARGLQRRLAARIRRGIRAFPRQTLSGRRRERRPGPRAGPDRQARTPSTTWKPGRSSSPRSPTSATPPRSPTRAPS